MTEVNISETAGEATPAKGNKKMSLKTIGTVIGALVIVIAVALLVKGWMKGNIADNNSEMMRTMAAMVDQRVSTTTAPDENAMPASMTSDITSAGQRSAGRLSKNILADQIGNMEAEALLYAYSKSDYFAPAIDKHQQSFLAGIVETAKTAAGNAVAVAENAFGIEKNKSNIIALNGSILANDPKLPAEYRNVIAQVGYETQTASTFLDMATTNGREAASKKLDSLSYRVRKNTNALGGAWINSKGVHIPRRAEKVINSGNIHVR